MFFSYLLLSLITTFLIICVVGMSLITYSLVKDFIKGRL